MWDTARQFRLPGDVLPVHDYTIDNYVDRGGYHVEDNELRIVDPVWGEARVGGHPSERVFFELGFTDVFRRLMGVFQLTLPHLYETIPNAAYLSRWHHVWGSLILARHLCRQIGLSRDETRVHMARTFLSDGGHRSGSHLADWLLSQLGVHGGENQHDLDLRTFMERTGVCDILRKHGLDPDDVIMPERDDDFIECSQPRDNVDRADYRQREMNLYMDTETVHSIGLDSFLVVDNQLVMRNVNQAWAAGIGHMLLSAEHWSDPIHRLVELLYAEMYKHVLINDHGNEDWFGRNPADVLYCSDAEQILAMHEHSVFNAVVDHIIRTIALYERQWGWPLRRMRLWKALGETGGGWPFMKMYPRSSPFVAVEDASQPPGSLPDDALYVYLPPFKPRQIEPLVLHGTRVVPLSELRPEFAERRAAHAEAMAMGHIARVGVMDRGVLEMIQANMAEHQTEWPKLLELPHMDEHELQEHLRMAAGSAVMTDLVDYFPG
jgi:hypothetical protein